VSNAEGSGQPPQRAALLELERRVAEALEQLRTLRTRAQEAEARSREYAELLKRFTADGDEPGRLLTRVESLEGENADLRGRLDTGREGVERMLARLRFLEEQR
jgi:seryl-tRNA synthetase